MKVLKKVQLLLFFVCIVPAALYPVSIEDITYIPRFNLDDMGYGGYLAFNPVDGTLHAAWVRGKSIRYRIRTNDGTWQPFEEIPIGNLEAGGLEDGWKPRPCLGFAIDDEGKTHMVFNELHGPVYYLSGKSKNWKKPVMIARKGNATTYAQIALIHDYRYVTFHDVDEKEMFYLVWHAGVWGPMQFMYDCDNPNLTLGENGMVYSIGRDFTWLEPNRYNAIFGYLIPGFTDWNYVKYVTNVERRGGKEASIAVGCGKIYVGWNYSTGISGDEKAKIFCSAADEPGLVWNYRLGGGAIMEESTGDPYTTVAVFSDGTPLILNGKTLAVRYGIWDGQHWSELREGDWGDGHPQMVSDGRTAWMVLSNTRYQTLPVTVHGFVNTKAQTRNWSNHRPVIVSVPDTLASAGSKWLTYFSATDSDGDAVQYQIVYQPGGVTINSATGLVQWTPSAAGIYIIGLKALDARGGFDTQYFRLNVADDLTLAQFSANILSGPAPLNVQFTDVSAGNIQSWRWDFGDGGTSTQRNPSHSYTLPGQYSVQLIVQSPSKADTLLREHYIQVVIPRPVSGFTASPVSGPSPLNVEFTDQSSGNITEWLWDFGDGGVSTVRNATHQYQSPGSYSVQLIVTGPGGKDTTLVQSMIQVNDAVLVAAFSADQVQGIPPLTVHFSNQSTGNIEAYQWYFGDASAPDGGLSTEQNPVYTYNAPGQYTVMLTVINPDTSVTLLKHNYIQVTTTGVTENPVPSEYALYPNHPNPFNMQTRIQYDLPVNSDVSIRICDELGKTVLEWQESQSAGTHTYIWNGLDENCQTLPTGIYLFRFDAADFHSTQKWMIVK